MTAMETLRYGAWTRFLRRSVEFEFPDLRMRIKVLVGDQATAKVVAAIEQRLSELAEHGEPLPLPSFPLAGGVDLQVRWFTIHTASRRRRSNNRVANEGCGAAGTLNARRRTRWP
ncbi:MAG: hypothetical protein ABJD07_02065 [Gemmatimonadaceae bacterium]